MLPMEAPRAYSFTVLSRIVLWQHVGDIRPLGNITKEKWPAHAGARTQDSELASYILDYKATDYIRRPPIFEEKNLVFELLLLY